MDLTLNKGLATILHAVVLLTNINTAFMENVSQATLLQPSFEDWNIENERLSIAAYVLGLSILQKETVPERFSIVFLRASRLVPISRLARALESLREDELYQWSYLLIGRHQQIIMRTCIRLNVYSHSWWPRDISVYTCEMLVQYKRSISLLCSTLHQHWCTAQVSIKFPAGYDGSHG